MANYTDQEILKLKQRWEGREALIERILDYLTDYDYSRVNDSGYINSILSLVERVLMDEIEDYSFGLRDYEEGKVPSLDLRGIDLSGREFPRLLLAGTQLEGANLEGTVLKEANMEDACFSKANLNNAVLTGAILRIADVRGANLRGAKMARADLTGLCYDKTTDFLNIETALLKKSTNPLLARYIGDRQFLHHFRQKYPKAYWLWYYSSHCGESVRLWAGWSLMFALLWGFIYLIAGPQPFGYESADWSFNFFAPFYYSILTFTNLGFGGIAPGIECWWLQAAVALEVVAGYVMLGGLISIFAMKFARRS